MTAIEPELFLGFANCLNNIYGIVQRTLFFSKLLMFFLESVPDPIPDPHRSELAS